ADLQQADQPRCVTVRDPETGRELAELPNAYFPHVTPDGSAVVFEQYTADFAQGGLGRWNVTAANYQYRYVTGAPPGRGHGVEYFPDEAVAEVVSSQRPHIPYGTWLSRWTGVTWFGRPVQVQTLTFLDGLTAEERGRLR